MKMRFVVHVRENWWSNRGWVGGEDGGRIASRHAQCPL